MYTEQVVGRQAHERIDEKSRLPKHKVRYGSPVGDELILDRKPTRSKVM